MFTFCFFFAINIFFIGLSDALAKGLLTDEYINGARILALNLTNGAVQSYVWWVKSGQDKVASETQRYEEEGLQIGKKPAHSYPWWGKHTCTYWRDTRMNIDV